MPTKTVSESIATMPWRQAGYFFQGERTELGVLEVEGQQAQHVVPQAWPTSWAAGGSSGRGPGERRGASSGRAPASWKVRLTEFMQ